MVLEVFRMLLTLLQFFASKFLVLALHLEAGSFPRPLSPQEEIRTFAALRAGDPSAREKLIRHNLRLVAHIAKKYYALPSEQDDLISIGTIGLMKAVDTFDSTRRARFSTYASRCIENELRMHFRRERKNAPTLSLQETLDAGRKTLPSPSPMCCRTASAWRTAAKNRTMPSACAASSRGCLPGSGNSYY